MSIEKIGAYYKKKIDPNVADYIIHGWESEDAHLRRLSILYREIKLKGKSLLDVGCGTGPLYKFLTDMNVSCSYVGIDILPEMVNVAKDRYPETVFLNQNIFKNNPFPDNSFDVVYASGLFNLDFGNNEIFIQDSIALFAKLAQNQVVFNLLSDKSKDKEKGYYYAVPESLVYLIRKSKIKYRDFRIIEDYLHNDFTVIIDLDKEV